MLSQKSKIIILVAGAVIVFALLAALLFDLFPKRVAESVVFEPQGEEEPVDLSFLDELNSISDQNQVFDAANPGPLAGAIAASGGTSRLELDARDLAEFFIERFGTYSSDAGFSYVDDLAGFMAPAMQDWIAVYKKQQPERASYFSVETEVVQSDTLSFSARDRRAQFELVVARTEAGSSAQGSYQQSVRIDTEQDASGTWKVAGVFWGDRL